MYEGKMIEGEREIVFDCYRTRKQARGKLIAMGSSERPLRRCALSSRVVNPSLLATKMHFAREPIVAKSDLDYSTLPWSPSCFLLCIKSEDLNRSVEEVSKQDLN